jgi:eukaryotic-like serine/threonine-protein kinase
VATDLGLVGEDRIGKYRIVRTISLGQASEIMEAVQDGQPKRFALKQLLESRSEEPAERKAFEYEAKIGMEFSHPNMIRVYEFVKDKRRPYFVMEYFPSQHLRLPIGKPKQYPLTGDRKHRILEQSAAALAYMHDKGWVHRDLKPENILFNKGGEARLIDYALALRVKTGLGKLFGGKVKCQGTHSYMSPEQILCLAPAPTSDIYSFGVTCYELACGRQPFRANSKGDLLRKHLKEQASPPTVFNKDITPEFSDLVLKMIRKKPAERPQSMHEFMSNFSRIRIYKDDSDPMAGRDAY